MIFVYAYGHYQPAQDELAELFSTEYSELIREPEHTKMPPRDYVQTILDAMLAIQRHWQRGRRLKLYTSTMWSLWSRRFGRWPNCRCPN